MKMSGQLHVPGVTAPIYIAKGAGWAPETVWTLPFPGIDSRFLGPPASSYSLYQLTLPASDKSLVRTKKGGVMSKSVGTMLI
jgi:hypothetical protein